MHKKGIISLWMYRNDGGEPIHAKLKSRLEKKGHKIITDFDMRECYVRNGEVITCSGENLSKSDLLYHMNADEQTSYQFDILKALEDSGVRVLPNVHGFVTAKDKFTANLILRKHGLRVPEALLSNKKNLEKTAKQLFDKYEKMCLKPRRNHGGKGIMLFDNPSHLIDFLQATDPFMDSYYLEEFIPFDDQDIRVEICNNEVIGGYSRKKTHPFKTNVSSGGWMVPNTPSDEAQKIALKAAKCIGIETTVVDMVMSKKDNQLYILEVNPIMGIFVESGILFSDKSAVKTIHQDFANDELKLSKLEEFLDSEIQRLRS